MTAYRITNWDRLYETAETRKIKRLAWVPTRNKHDGLGFRRMTREKDPCELFTAWNLMLQIASKGEGKDRGTLTREGQPLEPEDLQMMTGFPSRIFKRGIEFFSSHNIAWLEKIREISGQPPDDLRTTSGCHPAEQKEQNRTEQKEEGAASATPTKRFEPPAAVEVEEYGRCIGFALCGADFVDYYTARGWRYKGGVAMKDWRAAVRTWKKNGSGGNGASNPPSREILTAEDARARNEADR